MSRFARRQRTFFVEEPVFDQIDESASHLEIQRVESRLFVCTPHLPRDTDREGATALQRRLLNGLIDDHGIRPQLLWFYTPMALAFARHLSAPVVVYDCMDELSAFLGAPPELGVLEGELFERADLVFTGGKSLYESKRRRHPAVHAFPSSVDAEHFAKARGPLPMPPDQAEIPRPRIGFFGVIDERLDLALIEKLASDRPSHQLVMLGPVVKIDPASLPRRPNLHWLGKKAYETLPNYLAGWDVAWMPFALSEATRFISPTKTLEYMAAGKPIVSTAIRDVVHPYGAAGAVRIAVEATIAQAVDAALTEADERRQRISDALVAATSWDITWRKMSSLIAKVASASRAPEGTVEHV